MIARLFLSGMFVCLFNAISCAQLTEKLSSKVTISVNVNIETYFIAEKLAVEHIGHYVFSKKEIQYTHQPIVYFGIKEFLPWRDKPVILRIAAILKQLREIQRDNAPQLEYLLYRNEFPEEGYRWPIPEHVAMLFNEQRFPGARQLGIELADSLSSFYKQADVGSFLRRNAFFYEGALNEAMQYIDTNRVSYMEKWYGKAFSGYEIYLMPGMPIPAGDDNYRAFGPMLISPAGEVAAMVFSSSVQVPLLKDLNAYRKFGFDNAEVTKFLTTHEIGHSFVNPAINVMRAELVKDTALFTPALAKELEKSYVGSWETCLVEHLVRLGEIRIAKLMGDKEEESRLRTMHVGENGFVLLPMLERKIEDYERNRTLYASFEQFLPEIFKTLHGLKPEDVDKLLSER